MTQHLLLITKNVGNIVSTEQAALLISILAATMYSVSVTRKKSGLRRWLFKQAHRVNSYRTNRMRKETYAAAIAVVLGALAISVLLIIIEPLVGWILLGSFILIMGLTALALKKR